MRQNTFGELYIQPGDETFAILDKFGKNTDVYARMLEDVPEGDGPTPGWGCELASNDDGETVAYLEGFNSEETLRQYLSVETIEIT